MEIGRGCAQLRPNRTGCIDEYAGRFGAAAVYT
jgi:hypothetical protein